MALTDRMLIWGEQSGKFGIVFWLFYRNLLEWDLQAHSACYCFYHRRSQHLNYFLVRSAVAFRFLVLLRLVLLFCCPSKLILLISLIKGKTCRFEDNEVSEAIHIKINCNLHMIISFARGLKTFTSYSFSCKLIIQLIRVSKNIHQTGLHNQTSSVRPYLSFFVPITMVQTTTITNITIIIYAAEFMIQLIPPMCGRLPCGGGPRGMWPILAPVLVPVPISRPPGVP